MTGAPNHVIGIDGGGTHCRVAISDLDGTIISTSTGGAANFKSDPDGTSRNLIAALSEAAALAGLDMGALKDTPAHIGLAGILGPEDAEALARRLPLSNCTITEDKPTSTVGALGDRDGVVIAIGTGSFVAIKRGSDIRYLGGWGLHLGDQASGAWLGKTALQRCALAFDGLVSRSDLIETLLSRFQNDRGRMVVFARAATAADFADLAPVVLEAAEGGDAEACTLLQEGAQYLNLCLNMAKLANDDVICLTGGLGPRYAGWLVSTYQKRLVDPLGRALDGALYLARMKAQTG